MANRLYYFLPAALLVLFFLAGTSIGGPTRENFQREVARRREGLGNTSTVLVIIINSKLKESPSPHRECHKRGRTWKRKRKSRYSGLSGPTRAQCRVRSIPRRGGDALPAA